MGKASILYLPYQFKVLFLQSFRPLPRPGAYNCVPCGEGMTCPALSQLVTGKKWRWISKVKLPEVEQPKPWKLVGRSFFCGTFSWGGAHLDPETSSYQSKHYWLAPQKNDNFLERTSLFEKYDTKRPSWSCREMGGNFSNCGNTVPQLEVDLERGASDVGEEFVPQINSGYFSTKNAPTEVWGWWMLRLWPGESPVTWGCFRKPKFRKEGETKCEVASRISSNCITSWWYYPCSWPRNASEKWLRLGHLKVLGCLFFFPDVRM